MDCSTPGFPVHHQLPELKLMSIESVMTSNHLNFCHPLLLLPSIFPSIKWSFPESQLFASGGPSIGASASVLLMNIQGWFPLGLTGLILQSKGLSRVFSNTTIQKHQLFGACLLYGPTFTSIHDYWKNHCFDYTDLCQQSDVFPFNMLSRFVITFLSRSKHLLISWLQSLFAVIWEPKKIKSVTVSVFS